MEEKGKNFVDFILAAQKDPELAQGFLRAKNVDELEVYFMKKDFKGINRTDCENLIKVRDGMPEIGDVIGGRVKY